MEGLLKNKELLEEEQIVAPELILYEVANAIWKHEHLLRDLKDGKSYLTIFYDLVAAGRITVISANQSLMLESYRLAKRLGITIYDALFVCLAIRLKVTLKTFDEAQRSALDKEKKKSKNHASI